MANKPISKDYLLTQLKNFEEQILAEKYATTDDLTGYLPLTGGTVRGFTQINGIGTRSVTAVTSNGYPRYLLMYDITTWYNSTTTHQSNSGFTGLIYGHRNDGNLCESVTKLHIGVAYKKSTTENGTTLILRTSNTLYIPCIVYDSANEKYYLALKITGYNRLHYFHGIFVGTWDGTIITCSDSSGTMPDGYSVVVYDYKMLPGDDPFPIYSNTDLDDMITPGSYCCYTDTIAATLSNAPVTTSFYMTVGKHAGYFQEIVQYMYVNPRRFMRNYYNGTWGSWYKIYTSADEPTPFGTCSTAAATAAKTVSATNFALGTGAKVIVKFTVTNTASKPTLNVNGTGAKPIMYRGAAISAGNLAANRVYEFVYDGTNWEFVGDINVNTNTTYSGATSSADGLMLAADKAKLDATNAGYGTCSTDAATAAKVVTMSGNTNWKLGAGSMIAVRFTNTNTAANPTLNVNGTGAKSIWYNTALITTSNLSYAGYAGRVANYVYDGTQYVFVGWSVDSNTTYSNASLGQGYGTCSTAAATTAKVVTLSSYSLTVGGVVVVKFTYAVPAGATLNVNSKGAKSIYYKGAAITADVIKAGDTAAFIYNGSQYMLFALDRDPNTKVDSDGMVTGIYQDGNEYYLETSSGDVQLAMASDTQATITGAATTITSNNLTANRALISNSSGKVAVSAVTSTELGYLDGVTSNIQTQINDCFQSVSDGKALIASAITDKNVPTDATDTFATMAANIESIVLGSGNATAADVLEGKTFTNDDGKEYTGTMTKNSHTSKTLVAGDSYTIPEGYHDGTTLVRAADLASQTNGTATAAQILSEKTAWVNGEKVTGTMTNNGAVRLGVAANSSVTVPAGYHDGTGTVACLDLGYNAGVTAAMVGTAGAAQVLTGYTFTNGSGVGISGTMADNGAVSKTITPLTYTQNYVIPAGYHNGSGLVVVPAMSASSISPVYAYVGCGNKSIGNSGAAHTIDKTYTATSATERIFVYVVAMSNGSNGGYYGSTITLSILINGTAQTISSAYSTNTNTSKIIYGHGSFTVSAGTVVTMRATFNGQTESGYNYYYHEDYMFCSIAKTT